MRFPAAHLNQSPLILYVSRRESLPNALSVEAHPIFGVSPHE